MAERRLDRAHDQRHVVDLAEAADFAWQRGQRHRTPPLQTVIQLAVFTHATRSRSLISPTVA